MRKLFALALVASAALVVSLPSALARTDAGAKPTAPAPGVSSRIITLGGTFPYTGGAALYGAIGRGMDVYFRWVNQRINQGDKKRGVYGRQIAWKTYDDEYNPAKTVQFTNQLLLQNRVFAIVGSVGTEHNQAVRPLMNQRRVPQLLVSTGASYWGLQAGQFPWTLGWQPDYIAEGRAYGQWIRANAPTSKIAVFSQNDDYGKDYVRGLKIGLGRLTSLIVSEQTYEVTDTSYASQIARHRASGADTWVLVTTPTPTVRALATARALNWRPETRVLNSVSAIDGVMQAAASSAGADSVNGMISTAYLKNPTNPTYANDATVRQFYTLMRRFAPQIDARANAAFYYYGFAKAYDMVRLLYLAGKNPTRASLMAATRRMNWVNPYALRGVRVTANRADRFPISQIRLIRYGSGTWTEFGPLVDGRKRGG